MTSREKRQDHDRIRKQRERDMMANPAPVYIGRAFGRLKVVAKAEIKRHRQATWMCSCICGSGLVVPYVERDLQQGRLDNCGCQPTDLAVKVKDYYQRTLKCESANHREW